MISRKVFGLFLSYELFSVSCRLRPLSSAEVQAFVISIRCAKCTAGAKSNGSIRRRTSARCVSISRTSMDFSTSNIFIFSMKRSKVFYFDPPPPLKPVGVVVHVVFFSWNNNNVTVDSEFHCSLQKLYLHGKYEFK